MKLTYAIQEALLALLCYDDKAAMVVEALVPPTQFDPTHAKIAQAAVEHRARFGQVPGEHTMDLMDSLVQRHEKDGPLLRKLQESLAETKDAINRDYVLAQARVFARHQTLKRSLGEAIDELQKGTEEGTDAAHAILSEAVTEKGGDLFDPGTNLADSETALRFLDQNRDQHFSTGIRELDALKLGPARKRLHLMIAPTGRGKSWWLVKLAKEAMLRDRKRVLYVTMELDETEVAQRMLQSICAMPKREAANVRVTFDRDEDGRYLGFSEKKNRPTFTLEGSRGEQKLRAKVEQLRYRPPMLIKGFPTGSLSVRQLEAYIETLEATQGFIPDLLLIDYPDLMDYGSGYREERFALSALYKNIRGLGIKRNMGIAVVSQGNRGSAKKRWVDETDIGESWDKLAHSDYAITMSQTLQEKKLNLARLFQTKGRTERDKFGVLIAQSYDTGEFCCDSAPMADAYWDDLKDDDDG